MVHTLEKFFCQNVKRFLVTPNMLDVHCTVLKSLTVLFQGSVYFFLPLFRTYFMIR